MRQPIHAGSAFQRLFLAQAVTVVCLNLESRPRSTLSCSCRWAAVVAAAVAVVGMNPANAAEVVYSAGNGAWADTANWIGGTLPGSGDVAVFGSTSGGISVLVGVESAPREVAGLKFTKTGTTNLVGTVADGGGLIRIGASGIVIESSAGPVVIGAGGSGESGVNNRVGIELTANQSWINNLAPTIADPVSLLRDQGSPPGGINLGEYTLTINGTGITDLRGPLDGTGGIIKTGSGTLSLGNNKSFSGGITLQSGSLAVVGGSMLGTGTLTINGGSIYASATQVVSSNPMIWAGNFTAATNPASQADPALLTSLTLPGQALLTGNRTVTVSTGEGQFFGVGAIGDGGNGYGLTKAGPQPLVFVGNNTYTGVTTVSAGTLQLGNGGSTGSVVGNIALTDVSTRLVIDRNTGLVYGGVISGDGSIVKNGIGGLTLTGTNTYTGTLTVNAGALGIDSVASLPGWDTAGRFAVGAAAAITFGAGVSEEQISTILSASLGNVDPAAGTGFDTTGGNQTFSGNLATAFGTRNIAKTGPNTLIMNGQSTNTTTLTISGGLVQAASAQTGMTSGPLGLGPIVFAGGTLQYSAANQTDYSPRFTDAAQVYAVDTNGQNVTWSRAFSLGDNGGISKSGAGILTLSTGTVTVASSGVAVSGGTLSMGSLALSSTTGALLDVTGGGRLDVVGGVTRTGSSATPLTIAGGGEVVFSGRYLNVGQATITVNGGAIADFRQNNNQINGQILVNDGVIVGATLANQGTNSSFGGQNNDSRATVRLGNANTSGTLRYTGSGGAAGSTNRLIQIGSGTGSGGAVIEQNGTGAVTFSGTGGFLNTQDASATSPRSLTLSGTNTNSNTISAAIRDNSASGAVSLVKSGVGLWLLSGTNTYTGTTTISQGALAVATTASLPGWNVAGRYSVASGAGLALGNAFTDGDVAIVLGTGNLAAGAAIGFDTTVANRTFAGSVAGNRGLVKTGVNTLIISGDNTPEAGTTIYSGGTLQVGAGGTVGSLSGDVNVQSGSTLAFNRSDNITTTNSISGAGAIVQSGTGRLTLSTANPSFSGALQTPAGTVRVTNGGALGTGTISPGGGTNSGTVEFEGGSSLPNPLTISARDSATSSNIVSVRNVSGTNSINGNVTISPGGNVYQLASDAGLLRLTGAWGAAGSAANTGRTIALTGAGDFDIAGSIPVQGTTSFAFTKTGTGTVFFSGTRAMAGNTTVSEGRLFMNPGSLFSNRAGTVTIASGATLAGAGTIENVAAINGIHSPGASPGLQTFTNNLNYNATGSLVWELAGNTDSSGDRGTVYDGVDVTGVGGQLAINTAATLALVFDAPLANADPSTVNFTNAFWDSDRSWQVVSLAGGATGDNNVFGTISVGADASGNVLSTVRPSASFSLTTEPDGLYLLYSAVPEPAIALLWVGGGAVLGLVARSRRRPA